MPELDGLSHACLYDTHTGVELRTCKEPDCTCICHPAEEIYEADGGDTMHDATMPDLPDAAIPAATERLSALRTAANRDDDTPEHIVRLVLEAAAPALRAQGAATERARIREAAQAEADENSMWAPALRWLITDLLDGDDG